MSFYKKDLVSSAPCFVFDTSKGLAFVPCWTFDNVEDHPFGDTRFYKDPFYSTVSDYIESLDEMELEKLKKSGAV